MAYTLNTGHALYPNLVELIGVQSGALVSHKTARTFTKHADASYGSGTWGEHFQTVGAGYTVKGASFSPTVVIDTTVNTNCTIVIVVNDVSASGGGGKYNLLGTTSTSASAFSIGTTSSGVVTALENWNTIKSTGTVDLDASATPYMLTVTRTGETSHELYVNTTRDINSAVRLSYSGTATFWDYIGGAPGQGSISEKVVWIAWFDKVLSSAEISDLYSSLGAANTFGLVGSSAASATFTASTDDSTFSGVAVGYVPVSSATFAVTTTDSIFSGTAVGAAASGALTTAPLKNNTGTVLASETNATVFVHNPTTGELVVKKTGQSTNGSGVMTVSDPLIVPSTLYRVVVALNGGAEGMDRLTAA